MKRMLAIMAGALIWTSAAVSAQAAPIEPADIATGAKWFVHIDFDAARDSKVGQRIHEEALKNDHVKKELAKMQDELGMDPQKDLHGATLYGTSFTPHKGVLIVYATADKAKFMAHLKAKPDFMALKTEDGKETLYTWTEHMGHKPSANTKPAGSQKRSGTAGHESNGHAAKDGAAMHHAYMAHQFMAHEHSHTVWAAFPKAGMGVFADSPGELKAALDVLGGKSGLASTSPILPDAPKGTVFSGGAIGLSSLPIPTHMALAKQIDRLTFAAGESDGEDFDHIKVTMTNDAVAKQLKSIIDGLQAMGDLHFTGHAELLKMIDGLKAEADGKVLSIDWKASSADVIKFGEQVCEFVHKHHAEWHHQ
ncbi:MAG TPA: hypothetical protein VHX65_19480 [Pirellulales bacterium]|jgi:hypothetical protein|nr:hypothetical protein [Pirellulales bacterium]